MREENKLTLQVWRCKNRLIFKLKGSFDEASFISLLESITATFYEIFSYIIVIDICGLGPPSINGLLYLDYLRSICALSSKIYFCNTQDAQPSIISCFASDEMAEFDVMPSLYSISGHYLAMDYVESSNPYFNAAQFELWSAMAEYNVSLHLDYESPSYDAFTAANRIRCAIVRTLQATKAFEKAREALARNIIEEIERIGL